ncbi:uncharacterized protein LOC124365328 [Homalodisca vitripennis]|uniref:uncharacterized protein LOC124365328 n=1 Tax=Homalodisca vitripennis TaxID=197043 RepID=UPI001EEB9C28|nr:uncharacterized protein LOC124365328 [Homalodisca vitripennis]
MAICGVCKKSSSDKNDVKCVGVCGFVFHADCIKDDLEAKRTRSTRDYKCKDCRGDSFQNIVTSGSSSADVLTKDFLIQVIEGFKKDVFTEMNSFKSEMIDLSASVQFVSDKIDASNKLMEPITLQFAELKKENELLKTKNESLTKEVLDLRDRMRNLEQYTRVNNVEVSGLPSTREESVKDLVKDVRAAIGVQVQESDVAIAHRVPSYGLNRDPALIIQFTDRERKAEWLNAYRKKRSLVAREVNQRFPAQRVYISDHLSPENKKFLASLKKKCSWSRDSKLFARKAEGDPVKKILSYKDIDNLV